MIVNSGHKVYLNRKKPSGRNPELSLSLNVGKKSVKKTTRRRRLFHSIIGLFLFSPTLPVYGDCLRSSVTENKGTRG